MKTAMIWGAGGGIGRALTEYLVKKEWTVVAVTHQPVDLSELTSHVIEADVGQPFEVQAAVTAASQRVTEVDLWVYTVGDIQSTKVAEISPADWQRILNANLTGAHLATHHSLPLLAPEAHLVYLGAISERLRLPGLSAYVAAKAGLEAWIEVLRKEERKRRITLIRPGAVATPLWDKVPMNLPKNAYSPEELAEKIMKAYDDQKTGVIDIS